jgi:hypothetical protein
MKFRVRRGDFLMPGIGCISPHSNPSTTYKIDKFRMVP